MHHHPRLRLWTPKVLALEGDGIEVRRLLPRSMGMGIGKDPAPVLCRDATRTAPSIGRQARMARARG